MNSVAVDAASRAVSAHVATDAWVVMCRKNILGECKGIVGKWKRGAGGGRYVMVSNEESMDA